MIAILPHQKSVPLRLFLLWVSSSCQPRENRVHDNRVRENRVRDNRVRESRVRDLKKRSIFPRQVDRADKVQSETRRMILRFILVSIQPVCLNRGLSLNHVFHLSNFTRLC